LHSKIAPKSRAFKILTFKPFIIYILREIAPTEIAKSLIPDISQKSVGEGGG
jgi:hypothetical protein